MRHFHTPSPVRLVLRLILSVLTICHPKKSRQSRQNAPFSYSVSCAIDAAPHSRCHQKGPGDRVKMRRVTPHVPPPKQGFGSGFEFIRQDDKL